MAGKYRLEHVRWTTEESITSDIVAKDKEIIVAPIIPFVSTSTSIERLPILREIGVPSNHHTKYSSDSQCAITTGMFVVAEHVTEDFALRIYRRNKFEISPRTKIYEKDKIPIEKRKYQLRLSLHSIRATRLFASLSIANSAKNSKETFLSYLRRSVRPPREFRLDLHYRANRWPTIDRRRKRQDKKQRFACQTDTIQWNSIDDAAGSILPRSRPPDEHPRVRVLLSSNAREHVFSRPFSRKRISR